jgi:hypothetical protein
MQDLEHFDINMGQAEASKEHTHIIFDHNKLQNMNLH